MKKVVLSGFKGDAAGRHYNQFLLEMAEKGKIDLTCIDFGEPKNILGKPPLEEIERLIKARKVRYLNLENPADRQDYKNLSSIDVVFIITPDITHCQVAENFLGKAKRIFIEKPLDAILRNVRLLEDFPNIKRIIFGYDHYLAKSYHFQIKTDKWLKKGLIGELKEIEFRLLEPDVVPYHRIRALDRGMIYDFFPHGLAITAAIPSPFAYPDVGILKRARLNQVLVAKYRGCKTTGTSFVKIDFEISHKRKNIFCQALIGKGVGKEFEKSLRISGSKGEIFVDIQNYHYSIFNEKQKKIKEDKLLYDYEKAFLSTALNPEKTVTQIPGALSFEAAKEILYILDEARWRSQPRGKPPIYKVGTSAAEIIELIKKQR